MVDVELEEEGRSMKKESVSPQIRLLRLISIMLEQGYDGKLPTSGNSERLREARKRLEDELESVIGEPIEW